MGGVEMGEMIKLYRMKKNLNKTNKKFFSIHKWFYIIYSILPDLFFP